jgi:hypothetical protein
MRILILLPLFCWLNQVHAQNPQFIEQELAARLKQVDHWATFNDSAYPDINKFDSLEMSNNIFKSSLLAYTAAYPATLNYDFKELETLGLHIRTSEDRLFRIYSWDTYTGGTAHIFEAVFQYKADNKVFSKTIHGGEGDFGRWYSNIYSLKADDKTYYIGLYHAVFSSKDLYQGIKLFSIENNTLNDNVRLIKTRTGVRNELGFGFNFFSVANRSERPVKLIYYEEDEKKLLLPIVMEDGKVTKKMMVYQFDGENFVQIQ